jgi:hypothetical protein
MNNRREQLLASLIGEELDEEKAKMLDTTIKLILSDMGDFYAKMWAAEGPGVMVFQPKGERTMFFMTLKEMHAAQEECERDNNGDLAESFRRIVAAAQKIDPASSAGYIINDEAGMRFFQVDYNTVKDEKVISPS